MAMKPTGDDVGLLVAMAVVVVAAAVLVFTRARAIETPAAASATS
jgi:hypothetical protein